MDGSSVNLRCGGYLGGEEDAQVRSLSTKSSLRELANFSSFSSFWDFQDFSRRNGPRTAGQTLPATRAGGQDDVSLNKLPQIKADWRKMD